ncbi:MAG: hypothetical protein AAGA65_01795 [Actinomycetota bacterium]
MSVPAGDKRESVSKPTTATYSVDAREVIVLSLAAFGPWLLVAYVVKLIFAGLGAVLVIADDGRSLLGALILLFLGAQMAIYRGTWANAVEMVRLVSGTGDWIAYVVTADADGIELRAGDHLVRVRWRGFSGHYITLRHLVLQRGGLPSLSLPMAHLSDPFVAGVLGHLTEADVAETRPSKYLPGIVLYLVAIAWLVSML